MAKHKLLTRADVDVYVDDVTGKFSAKLPGQSEESSREKLPDMLKLIDERTGVKGKVELIYGTRHNAEKVAVVAVEGESAWTDAGARIELAYGGLRPVTGATEGLLALAENIKAELAKLEELVRGRREELRGVWEAKEWGPALTRSAVRELLKNSLANGLDTADNTR